MVNLFKTSETINMMNSNIRPTKTTHKQNNHRADQATHKTH